jgi:3,4-dihydroxy 2-butanone 4-phosphate synthase/GTP cyclohydrolase II
MIYSEKALERVVRYAEATGISRNGLANKAGLNESTIRSLGDPQWDPRVSTLKKLEAVIPDDFSADLPVSDAAGR